MPEMTHHQTCKIAVDSHKTNTQNKPDWNLFDFAIKSQPDYIEVLLD